jgi:hypothetical protein
MSVLNLVKEAGKTIIADTPLWAKIVRISGYAVASIGLAVGAANPVTAPAVIAVLIPYSAYMTTIGTAAGIFAQMFKKK